jgi:KDO2-lipid IV(A) lauroyltransferase
MYRWLGMVLEDERRLQRVGRWLRFVPRRLLLAFCFLASWLVYAGAASFRNGVIRNMAQLLDAPLPRIRRYCRSYVYNIFVTLFEMIGDCPDPRRDDADLLEVEGESHLREALKRGKGAIVFAPHIGNFFYYYLYLSRKYRCLTVATAGSKELRPLYLKFQRLGCDGLDYDHTPPLELFRKLRKHLNDNGVVFLLGDFYRPAFPEATFFGRETRSPSGTAALALERGTPVVPFIGCRVGGFKHRLEFGSPVYLQQQFRTDQRAEATNELNRLLEQYVLDVPDQWFYWFNVDERWEDGRERNVGITA